MNIEILLLWISWWYLCINMIVLGIEVVCYQWLLYNIFECLLPYLNRCMLSLDKQLTRSFKLFSIINRQLSSQLQLQSQETLFSSSLSNNRRSTLQNTRIKSNTLIVPITSSSRSSNIEEEQDYDLQVIQQQQEFIANQLLIPLILHLSSIYNLDSSFSSFNATTTATTIENSSCDLNELWALYRKYKVSCQIFYVLLYRKISSFIRRHHHTKTSIYGDIIPFFNYCYYYYSLHRQLQILIALIGDRSTILKTQMKLTKIQHYMKFINVSNNNNNNNGQHHHNRFQWKFVDWRDFHTNNNNDNNNNSEEIQKEKELQRIKKNKEQKIYTSLYWLQTKLDELNAYLYIIYAQHQKSIRNHNKNINVGVDMNNNIDMNDRKEQQRQQQQEIKKLCVDFNFQKILNQMSTEHTSLIDMMQLSIVPPKKGKAGGGGGEEEEKNELYNIATWPEEEISDWSNLKHQLNKQLMNHPDIIAKQKERERLKELEEKERKEKEKWIDGEQLFEAELKITEEEEENENEERENYMMEDPWEETIGISSYAKYSLVNELSKVLQERKQQQSSQQPLLQTQQSQSQEQKEKENEKENKEEGKEQQQEQQESRKTLHQFLTFSDIASLTNNNVEVIEGEMEIIK